METEECLDLREPRTTEIDRVNSVLESERKEQREGQLMEMCKESHVIF